MAPYSCRYFDQLDAILEGGPVTSTPFVMESVQDTPGILDSKEQLQGAWSQLGTITGLNLNTGIHHAQVAHGNSQLARLLLLYSR